MKNKLTRPALSAHATLLTLAMAFTAPAYAGGSNYGVTPGTLPSMTGKVSEWPVPTHNKIARFDTKTHAFKEWDLASGHHPHGLLVDKQGIVWTTGNGNGTLGRLDPATGKFTEYPTPSRGGGPHTLVIGNDSVIWFTMQSGNKIGRFDTKTSGPITEYPTSGEPYGLALDKSGAVWFCRMGDNKVGRLDPKSGQMTEIATGAGSPPRRTACCG
jgi:virginiamycin B lyase